MVQVPSAGARERLPGAAGVVAAVLAASCCLLPLALIATGLAGAGLMMTMMSYEWLTLPLGVFGLAGAYAFYFREQRRCDTAQLTVPEVGTVAPVREHLEQLQALDA